MICIYEFDYFIVWDDFLNINDLELEKIIFKVLKWCLKCRKNILIYSVYIENNK